MSFDNTFGQSLGIHSETVVHRGDFDLAGFKILYRVIGAMMAMVHLDGFRTKSQGKHLMSKAYSENRQGGLFENLADHRHSIFARGCRIARAVGQEKAVGVLRQNILGRRGGRHDRHVAARRSKAAQDVALGAVIQRHHAVPGAFAL